MVRFLLTCDDGWNAPGLLASKKAVEDLGEVHIYATEEQHTGSGSKGTFFKPVKFYQKKMLDNHPVISIEGTPVDAVAFGISELKNKKIDLVISGINIGENISTPSFFMSGTCSAAFFAASRGIPSIAVSLKHEKEEEKYNDFKNHDGFENTFDFSVKALKKIVEFILKNGLNTKGYWNINIPSHKTSKIMFVKSSTKPYYKDNVDKNSDTFVLSGLPVSHDKFLEDTDAGALKDSITITPIDLDFTDHSSLKRMKKLENELKLEV
ncbi:MAG: 5'/3'-nucleotidase SurE [Candidatus Aenigmarchaeota archaeon]|nr:5'/3'-nucleotidase SurE [Candidatus Aenigmarchaeota archaeon]